MIQLHSDYSYCFLDFETTWLSHERDDIIQVGLVVVNYKFEIISYYSSYINPGYEVEKLKTIVSYTTGITPEQIMGGITLDEFRKKMISLIPSNAVFVWHNINFDLGFLRKYFSNSQLPILNSELSIDTIDGAKALIHYPPSYSLDILYPIIREQLGSDYFTSIANQVGLEDIQNHDALSDCLICIGLIYYSLKKIQGICDTYPVSNQIINKSHFWFLDKIDLSTINNQQSTTKIPLLDFPTAPESSKILDTSIDRSKYENASKIYYGNMPIELLVRKLSGWGDKYIICTNSRSKLSIIKSKCKALGLHNISFIKEQQRVDKDKLNAIYTKPELTLGEWWFFLKYCSHAIQWLGLLNLNTPTDYKIYNFIRDDEQTQKSSIVLATHPALFSILEDKEYMDYSIVFLDYERWYHSYLKYISTGYDIANFARVVDNFVYMMENLRDSKTCELLKDLMNTIDIFCWVRSMELDKLIKNTKNQKDSYEIGVIQDNPDFIKSNVLLIKIDLWFETVEMKDNQIYEKHRNVLMAQYNKLKFYMNNIIKVTPIVSDYITYTIQLANNFVEYNEFIALFDWYRHLFLSNWNESWKYIQEKKVEEAQEAKKVENPNWSLIKELHKIDDLNKHELWKKVYILNNNATKAKKIFEYLMQDNSKRNGAKILVENVTGGRGKVIAISKTSSSWIVVGGYEMLLQCIQEKNTPDTIFVCGELWLLHKQILQDISYWMS